MLGGVDVYLHGDDADANVTRRGFSLFSLSLAPACSAPHSGSASAALTARPPTRQPANPLTEYFSRTVNTGFIYKIKI